MIVADLPTTRVLHHLVDACPGCARPMDYERGEPFMAVQERGHPVCWYDCAACGAEWVYLPMGDPRADLGEWVGT